jgi:hypothetical protein
VLACHGSGSNRRLQIGRRRAHAEIHPPATRQSARNIRGPCEVADNDLCASGSQCRGPFIFPSDQRADRQIALAKQLDDGATHSTNASCGTGYNDGAVKRHASASDIRGRRQINCAFARYLISSFPRKRETGCRQAGGCSNDRRQPPYRPGRHLYHRTKNVREWWRRFLLRALWTRNVQDFDPSTIRGNPVYQCPVCENNNDLPFAASDDRHWPTR